MSGTPSTVSDTALAERIATVEDRIGNAASRSGRDASAVQLVAVCKTVSRAMVNAAYEAGLRDFGENRVQNALEKFAENVPDDLRLHMIGPLQSNKVRQVVGKFALIHSVDRASLIDEIDRRATAAGIIQPVLIQINIAEEDQKHGSSVEEAPALVERALACAGVDVRGFMTMAPYEAEPEATRPVFAELRDLAGQLRSRFPDHAMPDLSMGMTNDFEVAIEEGATIVRVGRAIFHEQAG